MRSQTRHRLKEDQFARATGEAVDWSVEHRNTLLIALVVVVLLAAGAFAAWTSIEKKDAAASAAFGNAMRTYNAPVGPEAQQQAAGLPGIKVYANLSERAKAAQAEFAKVASDYSSTANGKYAHYMEGVAAVEAGDTAAGERILKDSASTSDKDISALSKFALASLYGTTGRESEAQKLYREVADANTSAVPKSTAKLELAAMLEAKQPQEAIKVYEEIKKDEEAAAKEKEAEAPKADAKKGAPPVAPTSQLAQLATQKIEQLKNKPASK